MPYKLVVVILTLTIFLVGCGSQEVEQERSVDVETETPQEAVDLAIETAVKECELLPGDQCRDHVLTCSEKLELTNADAANNIEEKWCLAIGYQRRSPTLGPDWKNDENNYSIEKRDGSWEEKGFCICKINQDSQSSGD